MASDKHKKLFSPTPEDFRLEREKTQALIAKYNEMLSDLNDTEGSNDELGTQWTQGPADDGGSEDESQESDQESRVHDEEQGEADEEGDDECSDDEIDEEEAEEAGDESSEHENLPESRKSAASLKIRLPPRSEALATENLPTDVMHESQPMDAELSKIAAGDYDYLLLPGSRKTKKTKRHAKLAVPEPSAPSSEHENSHSVCHSHQLSPSSSPKPSLTITKSKGPAAKKQKLSAAKAHNISAENSDETDRKK